MASKPSSPGGTIEDLVTCSICLENFTDARALPCVHSFCRECLRRLMTPQGKITCPQCRMEVEVMYRCEELPNLANHPRPGLPNRSAKIMKIVQVPGRDVSNFSPNFIVNNLLEMEIVTNKVLVTNSSTSDPHCSIHSERNCELYCEDCSKLICYQCITKWGDCHHHSYKDVKETAEQFRKIVEDFSHKGEQKLPVIKRHLGLLEDIRAKQVANIAEVCDKVEESFERHIEMLKKRKSELVQAAMVSQMKNQEVLNVEFEQIHIDQAKVVNAVEFCSEMLEIDNPATFIQKYCDVKDKVFQMDFPELFSQVDVCNIKFTGNDSLLRDVVANYGNILKRDETTQQDQNLEKKDIVRGDGREISGTPARQNALPNSAPMREERDLASPCSRRANTCQASASHVFMREGGSEFGHSRTGNNQSVIWKLYPKNMGNGLVSIEDKGLSVRSRSHTAKFASIIGMPGFRTGKHSWKVKLQNLGTSVGIGVCLGKTFPGLCVMLDSTLPTLPRLPIPIMVTIQLDCEAKIVKVKQDGYLPSTIQFQNHKNQEVHPYFSLFPMSQNGVLTVVEMDGKSPHDSESCCIL